MDIFGQFGNLIGTILQTNVAQSRSISLSCLVLGNLSSITLIRISTWLYSNTILLFKFHRSIMIFVTLLTLLSFLFALIELDWTWSYSGHALLHAVLGLIVIICACINVKHLLNKT